MDPGMLHLFLGEVHRQVQFGLTAAADLRQAIRRIDTTRVWYSVQSLLVATGNVSRLLWPPRSASRARGETLRRTLQLDSDSPLASREFRNHFEHFDERLEEWGISPRSHMVVDSNIGSLEVAGWRVDDLRPQFRPIHRDANLPWSGIRIGPIINALESLRSETEPAEPGDAHDGRQRG